LNPKTKVEKGEGEDCTQALKLTTNLAGIEVEIGSYKIATAYHPSSFPLDAKY